MKNLFLLVGFCLLLVGSSVAENHNVPKGKQGKHKSHKKTKKKKSGYFYNFQH